MKAFDENIWKLVQEIGEHERHFNEVQHQYRALASGWVLAMFAGVQFVLTKWGLLPVSSEVLLASLGLGGAVGITQLWNLDIRVYHQLLEAHFVEGLRLEEENPWLPQVRSGMLRSQDPGDRGVLGRVVWFYLVANSVALLIAAVGLILAVLDLGLGAPAATATGMLGLAGMLLWNRDLSRQTRSPLLKAWLAERRG